MVKGLKAIPVDLKEKANYIAIIVGVLLLFSYKSKISRIISLQKTTTIVPQTFYSVEAFNYIKTNTPENSTIAFIKPRVLALYTSRQSITIVINYSMYETDKKFTEVGVDYILIVEDLKKLIFDSYIEYYSDKLTLDWENEKFKLYKKKLIRFSFQN